MEKNEKAEFIKVGKKRWEYESNGLLAVIDKCSYFYAAKAYRKNKDNEYKYIFSFQPKRYMTDMKEQILSNTVFKEIREQQNMKQIEYDAPKLRSIDKGYYKSDPERCNLWWIND